jgi:hypothetical protein
MKKRDNRVAQQAGGTSKPPDHTFASAVASNGRFAPNGSHSHAPVH